MGQRREKDGQQERQVCLKVERPALFFSLNLSLVSRAEVCEEIKISEHSDRTPQVGLEGR